MAKPLFCMAEGGRFELPVGCPTTDFESVTFGRSDTPPRVESVAGAWGLGVGKGATPMTTCGFTVI